MFKNYFKTAFRSLVRHKNYSIINISGLAAGIAVCIVIFIIIQFQLSYDNFHAKKDRIYRVLTEYHHADAAEIFYGSAVPVPMALGLRTSFPQIEKVAPIYTEGDDQILVLNDDGKPTKNSRKKRESFLQNLLSSKYLIFP
jgi:hypothetical protein